MSSIVSNQRKAYQARAEDYATQFAAALLNIGPAQRAALIASVAAHSRTPIDITYTTGEREDPMDAAEILDGDLEPTDDGQWSWKTYSGCTFIIDRPSRAPQVKW